MTRHLSLTAWYAGIAIAALSCAGTSPRVPQSPVNPVMRASIMPADSAARVLGMHAQRSVSGTNGDYVLGPGDIVAIRAFDFPELNQPVRVEGDGTITLPLLETVPVENCTVAEVQRDLTRRLGNYMYNPHITVFVEEYRSQQVAVVGAVQRPGLVSQTGAKATVLDSLSAAGGVTTEAGSRIFLIPAEGRTANPMQPTPVGLSLYATSPPVGSPADAIMIDTNEADAGLQHAFFSIRCGAATSSSCPRPATSSPTGG